MIKIGLTGGIGTGKSTVSAILKGQGIEVIDADIIARDVLEKYPEILEKVRVDFGSGFFDWKGDFRRKEFGNHIFKFPKQRIKYEDIIMPYIKKEIYSEIDEKKARKVKLVVIDAPTLIETGLYNEMDYVVLVVADSSVQLSRVKARDGLSNNDAINRINAQMSLERKKEVSNIIIDNNKDLEETAKQVNDLISFFKEIL